MTDLTSSFDAKGAQFVWDSTSLKLAFECQRKYGFKLVEGWGRRSTGPHLRFGAIYATALEHFFKHRQTMSYDEAMIAVVREALISSWDYLTDAEGNALPGTGTAWVSGHNLKTRENVIRSIVWYLEEFRADNMPVLILSDGKPAVEYSFLFEVDFGIMFSGHIDRVVTYAGHPYVMDQKTTGSSLNPSYFEAYDTDLQMSMYTFAGKIVYDIPVKGVIVDAAQIGVGFTRFARYPTMRSEEFLNEWYDSVLHKIEDVRTATIEKKLTSRPNYTACGNFGGCEFRRVCSASPEFRQNFLEGDFEKGTPWNPLARR